MARWEKINSRGRVDDRRAMGSTGAGVGITGIVLLMGVTYLLGGNPIDVLQQIDTSTLGTEQQSSENIAEFEGDDEYETFIATVLGSNNDFWRLKFGNVGGIYQDPEVVLFRGSTQSACGGAASASGPHYCPVDQTIYLDERFFQDLQTKFGAKGGDVAEAYVLGHEVGHHIQQQLGALKKTRDPIAIELQADCYAGMWAGSLKGQGIFLPGEINEAIDAAAAVGDDNIQSRTTGTVHPESWTHGSSKDRVTAFNTGYDTGLLSECQEYL